MTRDLHNAHGYQTFVYCPVGFVAEHLEVLYDLDIEAQALARKLGMHLERTEMLNTDPLYIETLAEEIRGTMR